MTKIKGKFFWKQRWFSICSVHMDHKEECNMCTVGAWHYIWKWKGGSIIYFLSPKLWVWYKSKDKLKGGF